MRYSHHAGNGNEEITVYPSAVQKNLHTCFSVGVRPSDYSRPSILRQMLFATTHPSMLRQMLFATTHPSILRQMLFATTYPIVHAACRLNPPVTASTSNTSPAKYRRLCLRHSSVEGFIFFKSTPPHVTNSSLNLFLPVISNVLFVIRAAMRL